MASGISTAASLELALAEGESRGYLDEQDLATQDSALPSDAINWVNGPEDMCDLDALPVDEVLDLRVPTHTLSMSDTRMEAEGMLDSGYPTMEVSVVVATRFPTAQSTVPLSMKAPSIAKSAEEEISSTAALSVREQYLQARKRERRAAGKGKLWNEALGYKVDARLSAQWSERTVVTHQEFDAERLETSDSGWSG